MTSTTWHRPCFLKATQHLSKHLTFEDCERLDSGAAAVPTAGLPLHAVAARFDTGADGVLYFDANSIGPMPLAVVDRVRDTLGQGWSQLRRRAWNTLDWLEQPVALGRAIAPILGCSAGDVVVGDSTTVNLYKLIRHGLHARQPRRVVVLEREVFSTNRYVAEGIAQAGLAQLRYIDRMEDLPQALSAGDVAVVALSHVDYRTSARWDMTQANACIHAAGALSLWDLSHSVGAVAIELEASGTDMAVGCGYKYLCGGPGAPAFSYLHPGLADSLWPAICGWMGHADTFAFEPSYRPAGHASRLLAGTPAVLANAVFSAAADIWVQVNPAHMDARHRSLTDTLIELIGQQCAPWPLTLQSPRIHAQRGGHVAWRFEHAHALAQCLCAHGVVVSARKPDSLRFGVHPLTTSHVDLWHAVQVLLQILRAGLWQDLVHTGPSV